MNYLKEKKTFKVNTYVGEDIQQIRIGIKKKL